MPAPKPSLRTTFTTPVGHLALAMLAVELMAGMQTYLNQTILPLMATDLGAREHYGLVTAAAMVPAFLTMPLGGAMLARWKAGPLMTWLTVALIAGAILGALATHVWLYVLGEILRGLAAGALATVTMGVLVAGLPDAWRRLFLAAGSLMWIISSLVGPVYASSVSSLWSWRVALVAYLPFLALARIVMARQIRDLTVRSDEEAPPWAAALMMAAGVGLMGLVPASSALMWPASVAGATAVIWACVRVFPSGVASLKTGRPAAIATLSWVCAAYFGLDYLISPAAHDVLGLGPAAVGWALTLAGVSWSVIAAWCGAKPARKASRYRLRTTLSGVALVTGSLTIAAALAGAFPWWILHLGCALAGCGMGLTHQDTIIRCVTDPVELGAPADGISDGSAATAVTVAGSAGGAAVGTFVTAVVAPTSAGVESGRVVVVVLCLAGALAMTPLLARRAAAEA